VARIALAGRERYPITTKTLRPFAIAATLKPCLSDLNLDKLPLHLPHYLCFLKLLFDVLPSY
jgi:hypothetical protein